jgi:hypothetical protein
VAGHFYLLSKGADHAEAKAFKRTRAAVSWEDVSEFFTYFVMWMEGVEPAHLFNFDETNFSDDTNVNKCICKKGAEYRKRLINTSKQAEF